MKQEKKIKEDKSLDILDIWRTITKKASLGTRYPVCSGNMGQNAQSAASAPAILQPVEHKEPIRWIRPLFVFPQQNVNKARCPGEAPRPNTSPASVIVASDPLWSHIVIVKLSKDQWPLSWLCSAAAAVSSSVAARARARARVRMCAGKGDGDGPSGAPSALNDAW